jgi:hypothetical protein
LHPDGLPDLFIDRSWRIKVPRLLRAEGLRLVTLAEHYGVPADEDVDDATWLTLVGQRDWVALMKDAEIRRRPAEKAALITHRVKAFCLSGGNLPADEMAQRFIRSLPAIRSACRETGPFIYAVHAERIRWLDLS